MGKIIDSVRVRCKTFVRGCEISRKGVMHKGIARGLAQSQKEGKKRMRQIGTVQVPQSAFMAVLKLD